MTRKHQLVLQNVSLFDCLICRCWRMLWSKGNSWNSDEWKVATWDLSSESAGMIVRESQLAKFFCHRQLPSKVTFVIFHDSRQATTQCFLTVLTLRKLECFELMENNNKDRVQRENTATIAFSLMKFMSSQHDESVLFTLANYWLHDYIIYVFIAP